MERDVIVGELKVWRAFDIRGFLQNDTARIHSPSQGTHWSFGHLIAKCSACRYPASLYCSCGIYGYNTMIGLALNWSMYRADAIGLVSVWGRISEAEYGLRASHGRIDRLFIDTDANAVRGYPDKTGVVEGVPFDITDTTNLLVRRHKKIAQWRLPQLTVRHIPDPIPAAEVTPESIEQYGGLEPVIRTVADWRRARPSKPKRKPAPLRVDHHVYGYCEPCDGLTPFRVGMDPASSGSSIVTSLCCTQCGARPPHYKET